MLVIYAAKQLDLELAQANYALLELMANLTLAVLKAYWQTFNGYKLL